VNQEMKMRLIRTGTAVAIAAVAVAVAAQVSSATAPSVPAYRAFCAAGPVRCQSLLRTDVPIVANATAAHSGLGPADLRAAYRLASAAASRGGNQTVAIVDAYDDPTIEQDMNTYRAYYGIPPCTTQNGCFRKVNQDGEAGAYPIANPDWDPEIALDTEMVSAICPKCHILLVEASSADEANVAATPVTHSDLGAAVDTAVNLGATEVSNSYGSVGTEPDERTEDHYFNHPGVVVTVSAGDFGYGVGYPASSPYVVAIGGTSLTKTTDGGRGWKESAWGTGVLSQVPEVGGGTGSGCSTYEPKPTWQTDAGCDGRTVSDISAVADPATGVAVYDSYLGGGGWLVVGGTSVSSPLVAGAFALAGGAHNVPYPAKTLYAHPSRFFDVTDGSNASAPGPEGCGYLCTGGPGYDGPTGLGTPNGARSLRP
jgi:subtilase family serine protease